MIASLAKKAYRTLLPARAREALWRLRHDGIDARRVRERLRARLSLRCDVCRGGRVSRFTNRAVARLPYDFYRCRDCEFIFVHPVPDLDSYYAHSSVVEMGGGEALWNNYFLDSVEKHAGGERGRLLEIGFGDAGFLRLAHERGWRVHGLELSEPCVRHARERLGLPGVELGTIESAGYPDGHFDAVAAFNFIEHVPDLRRTLGELRRVLRPGGLLALLCPNIAGVFHRLVPEVFGDNDPVNVSWVPPAHLSYFNKSNFRRLLEETGFEVVGDESRRTNLLWLQHEAAYGPAATEQRLEQLLSEIESSRTPPGEARFEQFREPVMELLLKRMAWTYGSDVMRLEEALGMENAILYVSRKADGAGEARNASAREATTPAARGEEKTTTAVEAGAR